MSRTCRMYRFGYHFIVHMTAAALLIMIILSFKIHIMFYNRFYTVSSRDLNETHDQMLFAYIFDGEPIIR